MGGEGGAQLDANTANILQGANRVFVQQKFSLAEALTMGRCEVANKYHVLNSESGEKMFDVHEKGAGCMRCCCAPYHSFTLEFRPAGADKESPPVMTFERQGCCSKWLCCMVCCDCCRNGHNMHAGFVSHEKIGENPRDSIIGYTKQPTCGGVFTPTLHVMDGSSLEAQPYAKMEGPCIMGGCSELCCDFHFPVSKFASEKKTGDFAIVTKQKPKSFKDAAKEMVGDSDMYSMEFKDPSLTVNQKATLLSSLFLIDYMFFEFDNGMFSCPNGKPTCTICLCYFCGCLVAYNITCGDNQGGGGGGGGGN